VLAHGTRQTARLAGKYSAVNVAVSPALKPSVLKHSSLALQAPEVTSFSPSLQEKRLLPARLAGLPLPGVVHLQVTGLGGGGGGGTVQSSPSFAFCFAIAARDGLP
jgi:hypothetical protein